MTNITDGSMDVLNRIDGNGTTGNASVYSQQHHPTAETYIPYYQRIETYLVPIVFALIFIVGVLGNGTLILIFARHRNMRNVPNTYIISLALGDLLVIITCVPFTSTMYTFETWPYGVAICKLSEWTKDISIGVSVFTLTALSAERYCAISNPIRRRISSKPFTIAIAVAIWIVAASLALPSAIFSHLQPATLTNGHQIQYCSPFPLEYDPHYRKTMVMFKFLAYYAVPLSVIACFYIMMAKHLEKTTRNIPGEIQGQSSQIKARKKVAKMVLCFVVMFMICFLPHHIFMLWFHFHPSSQDDYNEVWSSFRILAFCLSFINSCINPIALYFISVVFRRYFNRHLFVCCKHRITTTSTVSGIAAYNNTSTRGANSSVSFRHANSTLTHQITISNAEYT